MQLSEPQETPLPHEPHESKSEAARPQPRWSPGWRFVMFLVLFVASLLTVTLLGSLFLQESSMATEVGLLATSTLLATWVAMRFLERRPIVDIGLRWRAE